MDTRVDRSEWQCEWIVVATDAPGNYENPGVSGKEMDEGAPRGIYTIDNRVPQYVLIGGLLLARG